MKDGKKIIKLLGNIGKNKTRQFYLKIEIIDLWVFSMDVTFCKYYKGDGFPPSNQYCRTCNHAHIACDKLWNCVLDLATSKNGDRVPLKNSDASLSLFRKDPKRQNPKIVYLQVNSVWSLPIEDFLHFISTGHSKGGNKHARQNLLTSPTLTYQEPWLHSIVDMLGGWYMPEIIEVKKIQK